MPPGGTRPAEVGPGRLRWQDLVLPVAIVASVLVIMVPLPTALLDLLLAANITIAVVMLLTTIYVRTPLEFSIFPTLLLVTTLARLVLNVATTRLILTRAAADGLLAAGGVVRGFGEFVAGDHVVVGLVIFLIIVVIQFVVITKGATRTSEVAARFALDGMPGRQMAIDADLSAGVIGEREARQHRLEITRQADFYGAMDGASKFVRGDAIAGIVITLVNIVGGLSIGVIGQGMSLPQAASLFTKLTIGDGLVSQVPAFLISLAAGLLVTRSTSEVDLPAEFLSQLFSRPRALAVTGGFVGVLMFTSLPTIPLVVVGGGCLAVALAVARRERDVQLPAQPPAKTGENKAAEERIEDYLAVDPLEIEIGVGVIRLADAQRGGDLLERVQHVRQNVAADLGIVMPKVRIRDNVRVDQNAYRIKIAGVPVADGTVYPSRLLAIDSGHTTGTVKGMPTREPAVGAEALWIEPDQRRGAEAAGYRVVEPAGVLAAHLADVVRRHADEMLTRDASKHLVEQLKQTSPAVVDELIPGQMKLPEVQRILQMLLCEGVSIRQLGLILETLGDCAQRTKDPIRLAESVRQRLARAISARYRDRENRLHVVTLEPALEDRIRDGLVHNQEGLSIRMSPRWVEAACRAIAQEVDGLILANRPPVILVGPQLRPALRAMTAPHLPQLVVLSYHEVTRDTQIESVGMVADPAPLEQEVAGAVW